VTGTGKARWAAGVLLLLAGLGASAAACGYDQGAHEKEVVARFTAAFPQARWGANCGDGGPDQGPTCHVGFALRDPGGGPESIYELWREIDITPEGRATRLNEVGRISAAEVGDGGMRAVRVYCPADASEPSSKLDFDELRDPDKADNLFKKLRCAIRPVPGSSFAAVGK
jgi:hypothetical protein